jgi:hypothetical protein
MVKTLSKITIMFTLALLTLVLVVSATEQPQLAVAEDTGELPIIDEPLPYEPVPPPADNDYTGNGWMSGGGYFIDDFSGEKVTHGFEIHSNTADTANRLQFSWGTDNSFRLKELTSVNCFTIEGSDGRQIMVFFCSGIGQLNIGAHSEENAMIRFNLTDAGEPGTLDVATFFIRTPLEPFERVLTGYLTGGNHRFQER